MLENTDISIYDMNLRAAENFLRGFEWFYHLDTLEIARVNCQI